MSKQFLEAFSAAELIVIFVMSLTHAFMWAVLAIVAHYQFGLDVQLALKGVALLTITSVIWNFRAVNKAREKAMGSQ